MDELHYQVNLLKAMNQKLSGRDKMFRLVCDTTNNAFLYYSFEKSEVVTLGNWDDHFSFRVKDSREFVRICEEFEENNAQMLKDVLYLEKSGLERSTVECHIKNGRKWLEFETRVSYDEAGVPTDKIICIRDITKFKNQNDELKYMAYYDSLTGLYNRNYFVMRLGEFVRKAEEEQCVVSVLFIDIDDFRKINDGMGLVVGDEVVQQYGQFLCSFLSENVIVCHMNSDVFCMAIYDPCGSRTVEAIHKKIQERIQKGFVLTNGLELHLTVSIGVAEYPEASKSALELINCAEIVMFKAKSAGKDSIQYFDAPILRDFLDTVAIENKLKEAVFNKNFCLHFQPQYCTDNQKLRGVEALIRWRDEENKMISPAVFIPIAEKNGAIIPIGNWVMEESIRYYAEWKRKYDYPLIMSINISAIQYKRKDFVPQLLDIMQRYQVEPSEIELEITESILIEDFAEVKEKLMMLRDYGIRISLDDFGTGFSSLAYLNGLPIDTLKIDKSFVDRVNTDESTRIITESIVSMVSRLGYESVAEGVETKEQLEYMQKIGCNVIQGYLLGKPMPPEEMEQLLVKLL
ncbi:MAG: bifunctional diguanylate cyclase/phosphodiesterase [Lachnospiraceae bacterium]|nr:bifunctional diguanylate cyclase/phosphodiesterase [Lachnospiraceae bacterium]MBQ7781728.1 bifunctional diguanylate cyclase/phosphodiesterase [Lachnospiraceae bacterium]